MRFWPGNDHWRQIFTIARFSSIFKNVTSCAFSRFAVKPKKIILNKRSSKMDERHQFNISIFCTLDDFSVVFKECFFFFRFFENFFHPIKIYKNMSQMHLPSIVYGRVSSLVSFSRFINKQSNIKNA